MRAYVINLARSPQRRAHIVSELERTGIDYEIVTAVDGRDLDMSDPRVAGSITPEMFAQPWFMPSHVACALSHQRAYRAILAAGDAAGLVLEDDVSLPDDLASLADTVAAQLVGAEIAMLNYDSEGSCKMSSEGLVRLPRSRALALPLDIGQPASGAAYIITRQACERMAASVPPVAAKCDHWRHHYENGVVDRLRCLVPLAVTKNPDFESTVGYNSPTSLKSRLLKLNLRPLQKAAAYRRRRIFRKWTRVEIVTEPFIAKPSRIE